jgi:DNA replication protein DnaC
METLITPNEYENGKPKKPEFVPFFPKMIEVEYVCKKHGKVRTQVFEGREANAQCPLCAAEEEKLENEKLEKIRKEAAERAKREQFEQQNIEPEYWDKKLEDVIIKTESQKQAVDAVKKMIERKSGKVILLGSNGVGKTLLGSIAVQSLGGKLLSMYEITTLIRQSYTAKAEKTELDIVRELAGMPMLVIDELGRTKGSSAELNWLSYILDKRHTRHLPFMLLSNTHLNRNCPNHGCEQCFENFVNNDVISRLRQNSEIITIEAPDFRATGGTK